MQHGKGESVVRTIILLAVTALFGYSVQAQTCSANPLACAPVSSYTFGEAKEHGHDNFTLGQGTYCGRWLVSDPTNNEGNNFLGNVICADSWLYGPTWYYYDWSADIDDSVQKIITWEAQQTPPNIWVVFDNTCMLATSVSTRPPPR